MLYSLYSFRSAVLYSLSYTFHTTAFLIRIPAYFYDDSRLLLHCLRNIERGQKDKDISLNETVKNIKV